MFSSVMAMIGDISYTDTFVKPHNDTDPNTLRFEVLAFLIMSIFLLLMPILLMNLLVSFRLTSY